MKRSLLALLVGIAAWGIPPALGLPMGSSARAQMDFSLDEAESGGEGDAGGGDDGGGMTFSEEEAEGGGEAGGDIEGGGDLGGDDIIGTLVEEGDLGPAEEGERAPRGEEAVEEIYAVQQIYALRINRVEVAPSLAFTINDPYVSHPAFGLGVNYWFTNVLAVGANFLWYQGLESESDLNFFVRRSTRLAVPITQWQMGAHLNFTYVPLYGKFAMFNKWIFQWDAYLIGGVGFMRTRPVPVIDPEIRQFDYDMRVAFNAGLGFRIFVSRWLSVFTEFRDYAYLERFENLQVALGEERLDESTWFADSTTFTNNTTVQVGVTIFFPFTFEYKLPK